MNQLLAMKCFARVVETASFTTAADSLDMPKATVSKMVRDLEVYLGVQLLRRTTRRLHVTADGHTYYERTVRLIRDLEEIDTGFAGAHKKPRGRIRVDLGGVPARKIVLPALPGFLERYPDIKIDFGVTDRTVDLMDEDADCVIRGGELSELSLISRLLGTVSWTTCATPDYLSKHGTPKDPRDLESKHRLVGFQSGRTGRLLPALFVKRGERYEIEGPCDVSVNDGGSRIAAGLAGLGVIQTFTFAIKSHLASGELVPILVGWEPPPYPFHVLYSPNRNLSNRTRVFIDWLVEVFDKLE